MVENRLYPDERPRYEAPTAVRLDDMHAAQGDCSPFGSGDTGVCATGNLALEGCNPGNDGLGPN